MNRALLFLSAESPMHAGADVGIGSVDLQIQRESASRLPLIWGQSLKGALRDRCRSVWPDDGLLQKVFGSDPPGAVRTGLAGASTSQGSAAMLASGPPRPGSLKVGDAQLVAFPAPTLVSNFAYLSSPLALARTARKVSLLGGGSPNVPYKPADSALLSKGKPWDGEIVVGPFVLTGNPSPGVVSEWSTWLGKSAYPLAEVHNYSRTKIESDLLIVGDDVLTAITVECVEITPRVQLDENKAVQQGPFYSEYLPAESLLVALLETSVQSHLENLRETLDGEILQLGGDETIGKGLLWARFFSAQPITAAAIQP